MAFLNIGYQKEIENFVIPGHIKVQGRVSLSLPVQFVPPLAAAVSISLILVSSPCPHETEQLLQFPKSPHLQCTVNVRTANFIGTLSMLQQH